MKRGFSLIELVISMVVIAVVFSVIPKIIYVTNKAQGFAVKEDALFNGMSLVSMITKLPWDNANVNDYDILRVNSGVNECNATSLTPFYRVGGFVGSRECNSSGVVLSASAIGMDDALYNDIDDYNNYNANTINQLTGNNQYGLGVSVVYLNEPALNIDTATRTATLTLDDTVNPNSTNIKRVTLNVTYQGSRVSMQGDSIASFHYYTPNIGQMYIKERRWQ